jgi:hypothetical protein
MYAISTLVYSRLSTRLSEAQGVIPLARGRTEQYARCDLNSSERCCEDSKDKEERHAFGGALHE